MQVRGVVSRFNLVDEKVQQYRARGSADIFIFDARRCTRNIFEMAAPAALAGFVEIFRSRVAYMRLSMSDNASQMLSSEVVAGLLAWMFRFAKSEKKNVKRDLDGNRRPLFGNDAI